MVTGAARGIGRAACLRFAADAAAHGDPAALTLAAVDLQSDEIEALAAELTASGVHCVPVAGDLADPEFPTVAVATATAALGGLDVLVSNAGISRHGALKDLALADWDAVMAVDCRASWLLAKAAYPHLKAARGRIVIVSSITGIHPQPRVGAYSVAKAGLIALGRQLALEWGPDGIAVNVVSPGPTHTTITDRIYSDPEARAVREALMPNRRIGAAEDVAAAIAFLAGADARQCNGTNLVVDGGLSQSVMERLPYIPAR
ncbi:MAG: SDR family NAD(P)-dependent oxidoreductase [Gammaproteobacteria bacterium]